LLELIRPSERNRKKLEIMRNLYDWHSRINLTRLVETGEEPALAINPADRILER
jgi:hypothetical protein